MLQQISNYKAIFSLKELSNLFDFKSNENRNISINTDSRNISNDEIFLPLIGEKFDGHDFINSVIQKNIDTQNKHLSFCEKNKLVKVKEDYRHRLIFVENTLEAYHLIANYYRKKINPKVVAVTGSSGKTTVKELISYVLSAKYRVYKTEANFNNEFGVPKTILEMPKNTQVLVLELAMRGKGQISYLAKTIEPDIGIITNVGSAHVGMLGSKEAIIQAKCELLEHLKANGITILHNDKNLLENAKKIWKGKIKTFDFEMAQYMKQENGKTFFSFCKENYQINTTGKIHVINSICAIETAQELSLSSSEIQSGLDKFSIPEGRGNLIVIDKDIYIINESYNANPDSVKVAVSNLMENWQNDCQRILVLGELAELGEHQDSLLNNLNNWLSDKPLSLVITVGGKLNQIKNSINVKNIEECCAILKGQFKDKTVVLIKGSHVAGLERIIENLKK